MHQIINNPLLKLMIEVSMSVIGSAGRARLRFYSGSEQQNIKDLKAFGIRSEMLPPELGGTSYFDYDVWLGNRLRNEL